MNRIRIKYTPAKNNICSNLEIWNDLKGYTCEKIGHTFYGKDADIMLEYFQNAIIKENSKVINYGIYIEKMGDR